MPKAPKRSKPDIAAELEHRAKVERTKKRARAIFTPLAQLKTIYDAQTALNATAGHIKYGLVVAENRLKVSDLAIDMEKGKESDVKHVVRTLLDLLAEDNAKEASNLLELMGSKLPEFLANRALKDPMSSITVDEFIA